MSLIDPIFVQLFNAPHVERVNDACNLNLLVESILYGRLRDIFTKWRVCERCNHSVREFESEMISATFSQVSGWVTSTGESNLENIPAFSSQKTSLYADYKYFHDIFGKFITIQDDDDDSGCPTAESVILSRGSRLSISIPRTSPNSYEDVFDWADFGIPEVNASSSTFWMSTAGAHTPLHYDSYGNNVIIQLHGTKKWHIWLPSNETDIVLSPTRVPYEESSIYANTRVFDPIRESDLLRCPPDLTVCLSAGDVLYLPKHCWHFVITESDLAISVNAWVPSVSDMTAPFFSASNSAARRTYASKVENETEEVSGIPHHQQHQDDMYDRATEAICRFAIGGIMHALLNGSKGGISGDTKEEDDALLHMPKLGDICAREGWITPSSSVSSAAKSESTEDNATSTAESASEPGGHASEFVREGEEMRGQKRGAIPSEIMDLLDHKLNMQYVLHTIKEIKNATTAKSDEGDAEDGDVEDVNVDEKILFQTLVGSLLHPKSLKRSLDAMLNSV